VSIKLRRVIQAVFHAANGQVRTNKPNGESILSESFDISRGVLQGDIFSPVAFIAGLMQIFSSYDIPGSGVTVGYPPHQVTISSLEYADDAALIDKDAESASVRTTSIAVGSRTDASMEISIPKTKAMHIHPQVKVTRTETEEIDSLNLKFACPTCTRKFPTRRGCSIHQTRWCLQDPEYANTRSRTGSLADKAVQRQKRIQHEATLEHVVVEGQQLENVYLFDYLGCRNECDCNDLADVKHRMDLAQATFSSLNHIWKDHRLRLQLKIRLYKASVCSTLAHESEAWDLTKCIEKRVNGFNSRCLHTITNRSYRSTASNPEFNLLLSIRKRRHRYAGHVLRMDTSRLVRKTLAAYVSNGRPEGSILQDCEEVSFNELTRRAEDRADWRKATSLIDSIALMGACCSTIHTIHTISVLKVIVGRG